MYLGQSTVSQSAAPGNTPCGGALSAFLSWIWVWLTAKEVLESEPDTTQAPSYYVYMNRSDYRREAKPVAPALNRRIYRHLLPKDLTVNQFYERLTRISVHGRAVIYKLMYWGSTTKRCGRLIGDEQYKAMEQLHRLADGIWDANSLPGWSGLLNQSLQSSGSRCHGRRQKHLRARPSACKRHVTSTLNLANDDL